MSLSQPALFRSVPNKDYLNLFHDGMVDGQKVVDILKYKKDDVAVAASVPVNSIRYDPKKMPADLKERLQEWATALNLVEEFFQDPEKTILWFSIPNPLLGGMAPRDMIRVGRFKKLLSFIQNALDENKR
ncbi:Uncharacterised protein [Legionella steigerwaltii]|uniref:Antitoxin Xre/MbcA/ParS-like toxin-binding domain-containing protein n=1 Tax=Legionella steigerwaltii TaxID=460 RepID=A0A378LDZ7_9GAMM|nr:hypothetical protein [Legionella steigerwaltii]KTD78543.1 hypothetical protein Lstg_1278 [Legionella steigerwaltii]STY24098.1 Uncharacterised protein [Legionella steigerwaltii]